MSLCTVVVLAGGHSAERAVSLDSGKAVALALQDAGHEVKLLDPAEAGFLAALQAIPNHVPVFNVLHGTGGEDGVMQGLLQWLGKASTGSGVLASALAMNKLRSKQLWQSQGLPTPDHIVLDERDDWQAQLRGLVWPQVVKPVAEGSSVGVFIVEDIAACERACEQGFANGFRLLVEDFVFGRELTVGIVQNEVLPVVEIRTTRGFYDYTAKYEDEATEYLCPCTLNRTQEAAVQALALQAFHALGAKDWGRVDVMLDETGQPWLIELNTIPGMTGHSLLPKAAAQTGIDFQDLVLRILRSAEREALNGE